jgi:hypothetical protein
MDRPDWFLIMCIPTTQSLRLDQKPKSSAKGEGSPMTELAVGGVLVGLTGVSTMALSASERREDLVSLFVGLGITVTALVMMAPFLLTTGF